MSFFFPNLVVSVHFTDAPCPNLSGGSHVPGYFIYLFQSHSHPNRWGILSSSHIRPRTCPGCGGLEANTDARAQATSRASSKPPSPLTTTHRAPSASRLVLLLLRQATQHAAELRRAVRPSLFVVRRANRQEQAELGGRVRRWCGRRTRSSGVREESLCPPRS